MDLSEKIKHILTAKKISPSHFADEIGIQRSSMSHILAGRNKPSLDIVQKIIKRFPDLGVTWILDEEELPMDIPQEPVKIQTEQPVQKKNPSPKIQDSSENIVAGNKLEERSSISVGEKPDSIIERVVERVIIFYNDGTFQEYRS